MNTYRASVGILAAVLAVVLVALHAPGQMSLDSVTALYEAEIGRAVGWGPPFFSAVLGWFGGGEVGATLFVALNTLVTYGLFVVLLVSGVKPESLRRWRIVAAVLLAANPLFMFYAGVLWKDVLLATCTGLAVVLLLLQGGLRGIWFGMSVVLVLACTAALPLIRQQGILLAVPLAIANGLAVSRQLASSRSARIAGLAGAVLLTGAASVLLASASAVRVKPLPSSPVSVGVATIQAYDVIGMAAYALPDDRVVWARADQVAVRHMQVGYSPERIDTLWRDPAVRGYIDSMTPGQLQKIWMAGIQHDPVAYLTHRTQAFAALLGIRGVAGCVPAYWGVAGDPSQLSALGLREEMDGRDRLVGALAKALASSPVFRHWWYAAMLLLATIALLRMPGRADAALWAAAIGAWAYLLSFVPTSIACDVRYLYPVALIATLLCIRLLLSPPTLPVVRDSSRGGVGTRGD